MNFTIDQNSLISKSDSEKIIKNFTISKTKDDNTKTFTFNDNTTKKFISFKVYSINNKYYIEITLKNNNKVLYNSTLGELISEYKDGHIIDNNNKIFLFSLNNNYKKLYSFFNDKKTINFRDYTIVEIDEIKYFNVEFLTDSQIKTIHELHGTFDQQTLKRIKKNFNKNKKLYDSNLIDKTKELLKVNEYYKLYNKDIIELNKKVKKKNIKYIEKINIDNTFSLYFFNNEQKKPIVNYYNFLIKPIKKTNYVEIKFKNRQKKLYDLNLIEKLSFYYELKIKRIFNKLYIETTIKDNNKKLFDFKFLEKTKDFLSVNNYQSIKIYKDNNFIYAKIKSNSNWNLLKYDNPTNKFKKIAIKNIKNIKFLTYKQKNYFLISFKSNIKKFFFKNILLPKNFITFERKKINDTYYFELTLENKNKVLYSDTLTDNTEKLLFTKEYNNLIDKDLRMSNTFKSINDVFYNIINEDKTNSLYQMKNNKKTLVIDKYIKINKQLIYNNFHLKLCYQITYKQNIKKLFNLDLKDITKDIYIVDKFKDVDKIWFKKTEYILLTLENNMKKIISLNHQDKTKYITTKTEFFEISLFGSSSLLYSVTFKDSENNFKTLYFNGFHNEITKKKYNEAINKRFFYKKQNTVTTSNINFIFIIIAFNVVFGIILLIIIGYIIYNKYIKNKIK